MSYSDSHFGVEKETIEHEISPEAKLLLELRERFEQSQKEDAEKVALLASLEGVPVPVLQVQEPTPVQGEKRKLSPRLHHKRSHWIPI